MTYQTDGFNWIVRLEKGERLIEQLTKFIQKNNIPSCWISGIGGAIQVELGYYDLDNQKYEWQIIDELLEITSLQGNIAWNSDNELILHIHGSFSKKDMSAVGGHIKELVVGGTCEVFLHRWYSQKLQRSMDSDIGLKLLDL